MSMRSLGDVTAGPWINPNHAVLLQAAPDGTYTITLTVGPPITGVSFTIVQALFPEIFGQAAPPNLIPPPAEAPLPEGFVARQEETDATEEGPE